MSERRAADKRLTRVVRLLLIGYGFLFIGMVGGFIRVEALVDQVGRDRDMQTVRDHDAACSTFATLHRVIAKQPPPNRPFYRRLGFTDAQIDDIAATVRASKEANLRLLGDPDPTCPKEK